MAALRKFSRRREHLVCHTHPGNERAKRRPQLHVPGSGHHPRQSVRPPAQPTHRSWIVSDARLRDVFRRIPGARLRTCGELGNCAFSLDLLLFGFGTILIFVNFISLRQAVTPAPMLGRMTSTMRWLILIPAGPGALIGGWLGQHAGLRVSLEFAGLVGFLIAVVAWRNPLLQGIKSLPVQVPPDAELAADTLQP